MFYTFQTISRIVYGHGSASQAGAEIKRLGGTRALIIIDKGLAAAGLHAPVLAALEKDGIPAAVYTEIAAEPEPEVVEACAKVAKEHKADVLIGIGGGSALDTTKAASLLAVHPGPIEQYFGIDKVPSACLPTILVPTTAGTGSEITSISVVADKASNSKKGVVSDYLYAKVAILDPDLTVSLPPHITAFTAVDAFVHAMESYVNLSSTPFTEGPDILAMRMIAGNIRKAYTNGANKEARAALLYASAICGMGFSNTQNGVIHALGMAMPASYHLPHGLLMAAIGPMGIRFNAHAAPEKYALVAEILGCEPKGDINQRAMAAAEGFERMLLDLDIKPGLKAYGVKEEDLRGIAERAAATERLMGNNPRKGTADNLEKLLKTYY